MTKPTGNPRGRPKTKEYVTLMARVPQELAERVQRYARLHQQPISLVLRDGLELLLEEERYHPFLSDSNAVRGIVSDRKEDGAHILSDTKETTPSLVSDSNTGTPETHAVTPPRARSAKMSDTKEDVPTIMSDTKEAMPSLLSDVKAGAPLIVSDVKADHAEQRPGRQDAAMLSDVNYDTTKHVLGKLCPRRHAYRGTGQSVLRRTNRHCVLCDREKFHERKQAKRQAAAR